MNNSNILNQNNAYAGGLQGLNFNNNFSNQIPNNCQQQPLQQNQLNTFKTTKSNKNDYDF